MSKNIVVNEQELNQRASYHKINYTEFLEFMARCSEKWFEETEMAELPLKRKIEYFLENLFGKMMGEPLIYQ